MAILNGSMHGLLQGVSQQVARERLDGQVSAQKNMSSDPVRGLSRRPGARLLVADLLSGAAFSNDSVYATYNSAGGVGRHCIVNTDAGTLKLYDDNWVLKGSFTNSYLVADSAASIQSVSLRGRVYVVNTDKVPTLTISNANKQNPAITGFYFVKTGAFSKTYSLHIQHTGASFTVEYTTPDGTTAGDAALSTPTYIANQLKTLIEAVTDHRCTVAVDGPYATVIADLGYTTMVVTSTSGSAFMGASNQSSIGLVSDLPALLPVTGYNLLCSVGLSEKSSTWYRYNGSTATWLEDSAWNSASAINNLFVSYNLYNDADITLETGEGRLAGSDVTNEDPAFIANGITGIAAYQGRLVLLCGAEINMSAAGQPLRWYRSTVTTLLDEDTIGLLSGSAAAADFTSALQFNRDLVLFSSTCQAVIPGQNVGISPNNAQVVLTSNFTGSVGGMPVDTGRSVLYPAPISEDFSGFLELLPSNFTASQYTSIDATPHLPRYIAGGIVRSVSSTNIGIILVQSSGNTKTLTVQQYRWDGEEKKQAAWHQWVFPYDIVSVWFSLDKILIAFNTGGKLSIATVELQAGETISGLTRPLSDLYQQVTVTGGTFTVPVNLRALVTAKEDLLLTYASGALAGTWVGLASVDTGTWVGTVVRNVPDGTYMLGVPFESVVSPTAPVLRDQNGVVYGAEALLVRYDVTVKDTGEFHIKVEDSRAVLDDRDYSAVLMESPELSLGQPVIASLTNVTIPVRAVAQDTTLTLSTSGAKQLRILGLDYILRYHPKRRRV